MASDLASTLHARGMRVTSQRLLVHRTLQALARHATADEVLRRVRVEDPGLSVPTVYATLELLVELGAARRVHARGGAVLYDPRTDPHAHLVCERCGAVADAPLPIDTDAIVASARRAGLEVDDADVVLRGRCRRCRD
jgi:Fe2+ or Zn2+ uptake regulation protein